MLDGMVAVAANKASRRGEILNDLPDRISDVIIFAGFAHSGLMNRFSDIGPRSWQCLLHMSVCLDKRSAFDVKFGGVCRSRGE